MNPLPREGALLWQRHVPPPALWFWGSLVGGSGGLGVPPWDGPARPQVSLSTI